MSSHRFTICGSYAQSRSRRARYPQQDPLPQTRPRSPTVRVKMSKDSLVIEIGPAPKKR